MTARPGNRFRNTGVVTVLSLLAAGIAAAADRPQQMPTEAERAAVAALAAVDASIRINGDYEVVSVTFSSARPLSDESLVHLKPLEKLESVIFNSSSGITDAGLEHLKGLKNLQRLTLRSRDITDEGLEQLKQALPNCRISDARRGSPFGRGGFFGPDPAAARGRGGSRVLVTNSLLAYLSRGSVQADLKLTDEQRTQIRDLVQTTGANDSLATLSQRLRSETDENERNKVRAELAKLQQVQNQDIEAQVKQLLDDGQHARLQQILLQGQGIAALGKDEIAGDLKLSDEQREQIAAALQAQSRKSGELSAQRRDGALEMRAYIQARGELTQETSRQVLAVLAPEQRKAWEDKLGPRLAAGPSGFGAATTTAQLADSSFRALDRDQDGQLTAEEFERSRNVRAGFERAGIELQFPVSAEQFRESYSRAFQRRSGGRR